MPSEIKRQQSCPESGCFVPPEYLKPTERPADVLLSALPEKLRETWGKEDRLSEALEEIRQDYDYVIVDCPPNVGLLTFNALKACTEAIIPVEPSFFSLQGIARQMETLDLLAKTGHDIRARALITLYTSRSDFGKAVAEEISRCGRLKA